MMRKFGRFLLDCLVVTLKVYVGYLMIGSVALVVAIFIRGVNF